jgi:hypothetical protein
MEGSLVGARVQRVTLNPAGEREVALLQVRVPGETVHVVVASGLGVGTLDPALRKRVRSRLSGVPAAAQATWRTRLDGARLVGVSARELRFQRELPLCVRDEGRSLALESDVAESSIEGDSLSLGVLAERGRRIVAELERTGADERRASLGRALARAIARIERRAERIRGDIEKMNRSQAAAEHARSFVSEAARAPRGARVLKAVDWSSGEAREIELPLDPAKGAREQIDIIFKRARRLKDGAAIARSRLEEAASSSERLGGLKTALSAPAADLDAIVADARTAAPRDFKLATAVEARAEKRADGPRPPHRTFTGASGASIFVGRNAQHNDTLTLRVARPWDLWLHAKNLVGAHVVVPLPKGASCPADVLVEAAHLAAHFSGGADEAVVEVTYTPRRYVRKPRGAAPGAVVVDREKVIVLRRDDAILRRLLASEVAE